MTDIRTRLANEMERYFDPFGPRTQFEYIADALLSLPGIAIVELPNEHDNAWPINENEDVEIQDGLVWVPITDAYERPYAAAYFPRYARNLAAALLAAASAAEEPA